MAETLRPMFVKKHFDLVASKIHAQVIQIREDFPEKGSVERMVAIETLYNLADNLTQSFQAANPKFDYPRFMEACGFGPGSSSQDM